MNHLKKKKKTAKNVPPDLCERYWGRHNEYLVEIEVKFHLTQKRSNLNIHRVKKTTTKKPLKVTIVINGRIVFLASGMTLTLACTQ